MLIRLLAANVPAIRLPEELQTRPGKSRGGTLEHATWRSVWILVASTSETLTHSPIDQAAGIGSQTLYNVVEF